MSSAAVPTPRPDRASPAPRSFYLDPEGRLQRDLPPRELAGILAGGSGRLWVDIDSGNRHHHALLEKVFRFHPLAIEDTLNPNSRVKLEEYDGYLFMIVRGVRFQEETPEPYDIETFNLNFFLGPTYLVTVHGEPAASVAMVAEMMARSPDLLGRGVARVMHAIADAEVDAYFPLMDRLDDFIDDLEERVFVGSDRTALRDIFTLKRLVLALRKHLAPQREVFNILTNRPSALLTHEVQLYFRDIYDHVLRINDSLDNYRELLTSTLDSYLTQVSNRLASATKGLSLVATLSIPFMVISGMWGMNFARVPLADAPGGFWTLVALQVAIGGALVAALRWMRLL